MMDTVSAPAERVRVLFCNCRAKTPTVGLEGIVTQCVPQKGALALNRFGGYRGLVADAPNKGEAALLVRAAERRATDQPSSALVQLFALSLVFKG
jgi:hypothetical protein